MWGGPVLGMGLMFPGAEVVFGLMKLRVKDKQLGCMWHLNKLPLAFTSNVLGLVDGTGKVDTTMLGCGLDRPDGHVIEEGWGDWGVKV